MLKAISQHIQIKDQSDAGTFTGYASIFNLPDNYKDIVLPKAFRQTLQDLPLNNIKLLWQHDANKPIGVITNIEETVKGLLVSGKIFTDIMQGKEANKLLRLGVMDGLSIGYEIEECFYDADIRYIKQAKLWGNQHRYFPS